jgi:2-hydroxychromene-2-carboxylate isomerase
VAPARFYFDFQSPYAYLAAERIGELIPEAEWTPIAFPILLAQDGRLEERMRRDFSPVVAEVSQRAADRGLPPFTAPASWPNGAWSLAPLRAAVYASDRDRTRDFCLAAYRAMFVRGLALNDSGNLRAVAGEAGLDPDEVEAAIARQDVKDRLKQNTDEAIARGVTGIPTVALGDELFWGDDRLDEAAEAARQRV